MTAIAITVHRLESPLREMGLELFEAMLELHLPDAEAALMELDQRLPAPLVGVMPRRRRMKRTKTSL